MQRNAKQFGLESLELKALSVPSSLRFLLGIEYDVVLCVTEVGSHKPFSLSFPPFAETFRKLLCLCAERFSLLCTHLCDGSSVMSGTAVMPLLRYADYLPGALHVEELLDCLGVESAKKAKRKADSTGKEAAFEASFLDYQEFASDASLHDVHGQGFYLTLDYGLNLASHGHLVRIRLHDDWDPTEALREYQEFSGWQKCDLRFFDERSMREGGIIVFPSIQDVSDLLEKYEDEDSDDEGDLLPFVLRPVLPLVSVPSVEDSSLRKQRDQHWGDIEAFWKRFDRTKHTVMVFNLYDGVTLKEVLAFMEGLPIKHAEMVEDLSPARRRRAFITLETSDATKKALELDGRSTKGRTIRVQVAPPYIDASRRGRVLSRGGEEERMPSPSSPGMATSSAASVAKSNHHPGNAQARRTEAPAQPPQKSTVEAVLARSSGAAEGLASSVTAARRSPVQGSTLPHAERSNTVSERSTAAPTACASTAPNSGNLSPSFMNVSAKEFVPHFMLNANSTEYCPNSAAVADSAVGEVPPPPVYEESIKVSQLVFTPGGPAVFSAPHSAKLGASDSPGALPPYDLPPPYMVPPSPPFIFSSSAQFPQPPPPPPYGSL